MTTYVNSLKISSNLSDGIHELIKFLDNYLMSRNETLTENQRVTKLKTILTSLFIHFPGESVPNNEIQEAIPWLVYFPTLLLFSIFLNLIHFQLFFQSTQDT